MGALLIILLSYSAAEHDTAMEACSTAADCGMSVAWASACDGDVLQPPVGSGEATCDDGAADREIRGPSSRSRPQQRCA